MVKMEIQAKSCRHLEFGNPSSHTYGAASVFLCFAFLMTKHYVVKYNIKNYMLPFMGIMNVVFLGVWIVGFSRVFLGAHTYNQVASGIVQGTILALISSFCIYEELFKFYLSIKNRSVPELLINRLTVSVLILFSIGTIVHFET